MRVLVIGATGQIGRELLQAPWWPGIEVVGLSRPEFDITNPPAIDAALAQCAPDIIINAAAYTAVDQAETDLATAFAINDYGPTLLAVAARRAGAPLIHLSTNDVFDGRSPTPYRECEPIGPVNAYGRSKAAGESAVRLRQPRHIILRTSWVYASHGQNFVRTMVRHAAERDEVSVVIDQRGTPTAAASIAAALVVVCQRIATGLGSGCDAPWGTYHFTDRGATTWYGFAAQIFSLLEKGGRRRPRLKPITTDQYLTVAHRPANSRLDCGLIERTFGLVRRPWQESLDVVLEELNHGSNKSLGVSSEGQLR